ncbi:hypothetical protein VKT23_001637 [Stygiomarasmius scandens]|uniref:Amidohydrolase-related domain-containing protein n=1 Tax=Marasmiellus scandens TaxID=2682957 RepID=A0ABR1JZT4_9AGAR
MEKELPPPAPFVQRRRAKANSLLRVLSILSLVAVGAYVSLFTVHLRGNASLSSIPINANEILDKCRNLNVVPGPPRDFYSRSESDRFERGTKPVLIKNATIWTGEKVIKGGDVLLDRGIIKAIGSVDENDYDLGFVNKLNAHGAWLSPGIVDLHSHLGVDSAPALKGSDDTNSLKGITQPWLRSLDGLNTHDDAYRLSIAGGVTTAVVLPGSANSIGGQAFAIKLRPTSEKSPSSMLLEPPFSFNGSGIEPFDPPRWRLLKQACGENPSSVYSQTRMDNIWSFRKAYSTAQSIKQSQDDFCSSALSNSWSSIGGSSATFPDSLEWEALVDVLRGRVKIQNHCYEAVDLDGIIRLTNEFKFKIAAFHHAHETYLVPDLLKKMYGGEPPAVALFATNGRYKREAYRGSEFAPKVLAENGLNVVMKSDHPVLNSRYLLHEAQQAHYFGLEEELALKSVTVTPAKVMGMDHRIGYVKEGYDADLVLWDSHPLSLGATPKQVFIDGIPQLKSPHFISKPAKVQTPPKTPNWDREAKEAVEWDGSQPLGPRERFNTHTGREVVMFVNVESMYVKGQGRVLKVFGEEETNGKGVVLVEDGEAICKSVAGRECLQLVERFKQEQEVKIKVVDLDGGSLAPGLVSYGSDLGLSHIAMESSTSDGPAPDPLSANPPAILGDTVIRAVDGLVFESRNALLAYRAGVTSAITPPSSSGFLSGLSTVFSTGSSHALEQGAVLKPVTALHVGISMSGEKSVATQVGALRRIILSGLKEETQSEEGELGAVVRKVLDGTLPLIISVDSADIMASLIHLKKEVEGTLGTGREIKIVFDRAAEAHLVAEQIGQAGIGVILSPVRAFPSTWEQKRILPGPPLSQDTAITKLLKNNVTVALGTSHNWGWVARNARFDAGWTSLDSSGLISDAQALELVSTNLEKLLGVQEGGEGENTDWVATRGGSLLDFEAKVVGVVSSRRGVVDLF